MFQIYSYDLWFFTTESNYKTTERNYYVMNDLVASMTCRKYRNIVILLFHYHSAGVGRTGTYIAIDTLLEQAKHEGEIDLYSLTRKMRRDRVNMIQTVVCL